MQYPIFPLHLAPLCLQITNSDKVQVTCLQLAPLHSQQHYIWCSTGYFSYRWHHCTHNITSSDSVPVTCLTVGITVPTAALHLMQYRLLLLQLASLYPQQHYIWCSTGCFSYSWRHCTHNNTSSDAVPLLPLEFAPLYLQQHQLWCSTATCQQMSSSSTNILKSLGLFSHLQT